MHRFFVSPDAIQNERVVLRDRIAHQIQSVLRMQPGDQIIVLDNGGLEYTVEITALERKRITGLILKKAPAGGESPIHLTLYQSLLKKDNFEWVLQKCTEIGVAAFVPVLSRRTVVNPAISKNKRERWIRIMTEAAEQSRRGRIPELHEPVSFENALEHAEGDDLRLIPWEETTTPLLRDHLPPGDGERIALFIGPEGGYAPDEIASASERGLIPVSLGGRILRAETAAVVACGLVLHLAG